MDPVSEVLPSRLVFVLLLDRLSLASSCSEAVGGSPGPPQALGALETWLLPPDPGQMPSPTSTIPASPLPSLLQIPPAGECEKRS